MSSDEYQVQNIYRYSRKSYKKNRRGTQDDNDICPRENINIEPPDNAIRNDTLAVGVPLQGCNCEIDSEAEIASILNKKCPVITLAQNQLKNLLDETDRILCDNSRCCRSIYDFLCLCRYAFTQDGCRFTTLILLVFSFLFGILLGAASCGTYLGRINSPILQCVDNFFVPNSYSRIEDTYRSVV